MPTTSPLAPFGTTYLSLITTSTMSSCPVVRPAAVKNSHFAEGSLDNDVSGALTGEEGLKGFILSRPDLVLLDVALAGGMDGVEVLKRIRLINPAAKVVMVTGNRDATLARDTLERGALAYVDKPFDFAYLKRVVAMAFQTKRAQPNEHSTG